MNKNRFLWGKLWDLICYYYDGDDMYAEFEVVLYEVRYEKPKSNFRRTK